MNGKKFGSGLLSCNTFIDENPSFSRYLHHQSAWDCSSQSHHHNDTTAHGEEHDFSSVSEREVMTLGHHYRHHHHQRGTIEDDFLGLGDFDATPTASIIDK